MPDDRFLHRRCLHSVKVSGLTDFEYRVWTTYVLAADDYGIFRCSAVALQDANRALEQKPSGVLTRALQRLVDCGLLRAFEHQGRKYLYQSDWNAWQKINRPSRSLLPLPSVDLIAACEDSTKQLFLSRLELQGEIPAVSLKTSMIPSNDATSSTDHSPPLREGLTANGNGHQAQGKPTLKDRFERFWASYPRKVGKGAAWRKWVQLRPDDALVDRMVQALDRQRQQPQWVKDGGEFIPHPTTWLNREGWLDEVVGNQSEIKQKVLRRIDPWGQTAKTAEVRRLVDSGMSREDAERQVFK